MNNTSKHWNPGDEYITLLRKYLDKNHDALTWVLGFGAYCHAIDDIIDNKDKIDPLFIIANFELGFVISNSKFYREHSEMLYPLVIMASSTYMTSVRFEHELRYSGETSVMKTQLSDHLRSMGNEVVLAVIQIVCGVEKRREASLELYALSYKTHHTSEGVPC